MARKHKGNTRNIRKRKRVQRQSRHTPGRLRSQLPLELAPARSPRPSAKRPAKRNILDISLASPIPSSLSLQFHPTRKGSGLSSSLQITFCPIQPRNPPRVALAQSAHNPPDGLAFCLCFLIAGRRSLVACLCFPIPAGFSPGTLDFLLFSIFYFLFSIFQFLLSLIADI